MPEQSFCFNVKCNYISEEALAICPKCGKNMRTTKQVKRTGWLQLFCGLFLTGLIGTTTYKVGPFMLERLNSDGPVDRFTGTAEQAMVFLGLLGAVLLFGLTNIIIGVWHIKTGQRSKWLTFIVLGLAVVLFGLAAFIRGKYAT